ncbi:hypothetical protein CC78DRAFT_613074 [Lojkania enalia]|uniref:Uncharacterized protein n=1 Tax=Lojkania enalia TaxID=147567 RepID=A0A9P4KHB9_9PLEO|nr:hypothetical protein CC78DRAFT_613074 [Didymosphaeria enalia]
MSPPWVVFDHVANLGGDCQNGAEPDIAGIGVVLSFVLASIMTTTASILAMLLDQAHNDKGRLSFRRPIKSFRERFLDTEWKKEYAWRPFLDPLIIGLGDQQLITGYAVLISGWAKVAQQSFAAFGAHFVLILYICALSSSSHLAALITLRKYFAEYKVIAKIRMTLVVAFALFLLSSMIATIAMPTSRDYQNQDAVAQHDRPRRLSFLAPMFFMLLGYSTALVCILYHPNGPGLAPRSSDMSGKSMLRLVPGRTSSSFKPCITSPGDIGQLGLMMLYYLFLNPLIAFTVQILLAILSVIFVLSQKFSAPEDPEHWCGLQDSEENVWEFGQTLSVIMLLLPAMSACQTYLEGRHEIHRNE